jgi:hypothetical protein
MGLYIFWGEFAGFIVPAMDGVGAIRKACVMVDILVTLYTVGN